MGYAIRKRPKKHASSFGSIHQVSVAVSIGFPLMVVGVLMLMIFMISWLGTAAFMWAVAGLILVLGIMGAASRRII
jgi:hypothetical protein